ncbi:MAG: hypothetical protein AB1791_04905 [Chloroflexota bacterium]
MFSHRRWFPTVAQSGGLRPGKPPARPTIIFLCLWLGLAGLLAACSLRPGQASLVIRWTTESELDIIGFNLYRADSPDGLFVKVNTDLIPPSADPFIGGEYEFVDQGVERGVTYYYQLETIDRNGNSTRSAAQAVSSQ